MLSIERKVIDVVKDANNLQILKDIVGDELFRVIAERFSGQKIYFSNYSGYCSKEERDAAVYKDMCHGMNIPEIAEKYDISISSVYKIIEHYCYG